MYIIGHLKHESTDYICILGVPIFLVALLMVVPFLDQLAFGKINVISLDNRHRGPPDIKRHFQAAGI